MNGRGCPLFAEFQAYTFSCFRGPPDEGRRTPLRAPSDKGGRHPPISARMIALLRLSQKSIAEEMREVVLAHDGAAKGVAELEAPALAHAASPAAPLASLDNGERIENAPQPESSLNGPHSLSLRGKTCNPLKIKTPPNFEGFVVSCLGCRFFGPFWLRYHYRLRLQTSRNSSALRILPLIVDSIYAFGSRTNRRP